MNDSYIILLYIRLSVEDGDVGQDGKNESNSVANQRAMLCDFVSRQEDLNGCTVMELCDDGYSGTNLERPGIKKLLELAKERLINCVIVKDFSRFGRDHITVSDYVDQIFPFLGIRFISVNDDYDSERIFGSTGGFDINLRNVVNSLYSADISEKVRSGKRNKALKGDFLSPFAPIGYCKDKANKNQLLIDEDSAAIVRYIFELAASGMSVMKITRLLNAEKLPTPSQIQNSKGFHHKWWVGIGGEKIWHDGKVTDILRDERYLGHAVFGKRVRPVIGSYNTKIVDKDDWIVVEDSHEPLVSEDLFFEAQAALRKYEQLGPRDMNNAAHLFSDKLRCGQCGYSLARRSRPTVQYYCPTRYRKSDVDCFSGHVKETDIAEAVYGAISQYIRVLLDEGTMLKRKKNTSRLAVIRKQITAFERACGKFEEQKADLYESKADGVITQEQYQKQYGTLQAEHKDIQIQLKKLTAELAELELTVSSALPKEQVLRGFLDSAVLTREMVLVFVDCIFVFDKDNIHIKWRFEDKGAENEQNEQKSFSILQSGTPRQLFIGDAAPTVDGLRQGAALFHRGSVR